MGLREGGGNYIKGGGTEKRGEETNGKLGQGVGALKRGGLEPPYELWYIFEHIF